jgi:hypothetical protein
MFFNSLNPDDIRHITHFKLPSAHIIVTGFDGFHPHHANIIVLHFKGSKRAGMFFERKPLQLLWERFAAQTLCTSLVGRVALPNPCH